MRDANHDAQILLVRSVEVIFRFCVSENEEYQNWQYKVRIFLNSECSLITRSLTFLESSDREIDVEDVQDYATSEDFPGQTAVVTWMNQQLFNVLAQNTRGTPLQTVKTCQKKKVVALLELGSNSCVLTWARIQAGDRVLARVEMWGAALKDHVKDTRCEVADITMANSLRRLVPADQPADQQKMSHMVRCSDVKKNIIGQVGLRLCNDQKALKV